MLLLAFVIGLIVAIAVGCVLLTRRFPARWFLSDMYFFIGLLSLSMWPELREFLHPKLNTYDVGIILLNCGGAGMPVLAGTWWALVRAHQNMEDRTICRYLMITGSVVAVYGFFGVTYALIDTGEWLIGSNSDRSSFSLCKPWLISALLLVPGVIVYRKSRPAP